MRKQTLITVVPPLHSLEKEAVEKARGLRAGAFLWTLLAEAQTRMDPATWIDSGGLEAETALRAWDIGARHGFFSVYKERAATEGANRSPPAYTETIARRQVIRLCEALRRAGLGPGAARKLAAKAFEKGLVFVHSPDAIKHWQDREPPLGPDDETAIAMAMQRWGKDPKRLASHFVGLALAVHNPAARII
jgi:hypothetical protein